MIDVRARDNSGARNGLRFVLRGLSALLAVLFITSCGNDIFVVGTPIITMTAQRGHFTSYIVTIDEIEMTRKDGTVIELPTVSERVDLANLEGFVHLLEVPAVGVGTYVSATFFLDYGSPYITVDAGGVSLPCTLTDSSTGTVPTVDTVTVTFDQNNPLVITSQQSAPVNFNIDLEASNTINNTTGTTAAITVHPMFTVTAAPTYEKPVSARGLFVFVDSKNADFVMNVRPLHDVLNNPFGALTVIPNDQTYWNINGTTYVGTAGLSVLTSLQSQTASLQIGVIGPPGNPFGDFASITPSMTAAQIYVGSSLESTIQDHITGVVAALTDTNIEVLNGALVDRLGLYGFSQYVPVKIASSTTLVTVDGVVTPANNSGTAAVSVGQYIDVSGQDTVTTDGLNNPTSLDATQGQIRLQPTTLWGTLNSGTTTSANINLGLVQSYDPTPLNWLDSGINATAANYVIATPVDESATAPGSLLQFVGLANPITQGPPFFTANTVTAASSLPQQLIMEYGGNGSDSAISAVVNNTIYVNLQDPDLYAFVIDQGPTSTPILGLPTLPNPALFAITPATGSPQSQYLFTIGNVLNGTQVYSDPSEFTSNILHFTGLANVTKIVATGTWDGAGVFTATNIKIATY
jgi:hypothetical protein